MIGLARADIYNILRAYKIMGLDKADIDRIVISVHPNTLRNVNVSKYNKHRYDNYVPGIHHDYIVEADINLSQKEERNTLQQMVDDYWREFGRHLIIIRVNLGLYRDHNGRQVKVTWDRKDNIFRFLLWLEHTVTNIPCSYAYYLYYDGFDAKQRYKNYKRTQIWAKL